MEFQDITENREPIQDLGTASKKRKQTSEKGQSDLSGIAAKKISASEEATPPPSLKRRKVQASTDTMKLTTVFKKGVASQKRTEIFQSCLSNVYDPNTSKITDKLLQRHLLDHLESVQLLAAAITQGNENLAEKILDDPSFTPSSVESFKILELVAKKDFQLGTALFKKLFEKVQDPDTLVKIGLVQPKKNYSFLANIISCRQQNDPRFMFKVLDTLCKNKDYEGAREVADHLPPDLDADDLVAKLIHDEKFMQLADSQGQRNLAEKILDDPSFIPSSVESFKILELVAKKDFQLEEALFKKLFEKVQDPDALVKIGLVQPKKNYSFLANTISCGQQNDPRFMFKVLDTLCKNKEYEKAREVADHLPPDLCADTLVKKLIAYEKCVQLADSLNNQLSQTYRGKEIEVEDLLIVHTAERESFVHKDSLIGKKMVVEAALKQENAITEDVREVFKTLGETYDAFVKVTANLTPEEYEKRFDEFQVLQGRIDACLDKLVYHIMPESFGYAKEIRDVVSMSRDGFLEKSRDIPNEEFDSHLKAYYQRTNLLTEFANAKITDVSEKVASQRFLNFALKKNIEGGSLRERQLHKMYDGILRTETSGPGDVLAFLKYQNYPEVQNSGTDGLLKIFFNRHIMEENHKDISEGNYEQLCERVKALTDPESTSVVQLDNSAATFCIPGGCQNHYVTYEIKRENDTYFFLIHNRGDGVEDTELHGKLRIEDKDGIEYRRTTVCIEVSPSLLTKDFFKDLLTSVKEAPMMDVPYKQIKQHLLTSSVGKPAGRIVISAEEKRYSELLDIQQQLISTLNRVETKQSAKKIEGQLQACKTEITQIKEDLIKKDLFHSLQVYGTCSESNRTQPEKSMCDKLTRNQLKLHTIKTRIADVKDVEFGNKKIQEDLQEMASIRIHQLQYKIDQLSSYQDL